MGSSLAKYFENEENISNLELIYSYDREFKDIFDILVQFTKEDIMYIFNEFLDRITINRKKEYKNNLIIKYLVKNNYINKKKEYITKGYYIVKHVAYEPTENMYSLAKSDKLKQDIILEINNLEKRKEDNNDKSIYPKL